MPSRPPQPTRGPHIFVPPIGDRSTVTIGGDEGRHLSSVLRVRTGDPLSLADDSGTIFQGTVADRTRDAVVATIERSVDVPAPPVRLTLVQALPKGRKMDAVVQQATEVGVDRIIPIVTVRCVKQPAGKGDKLLARWRAVAHAAAQQSRRARLPEITAISPWPIDGLVGVIAWEEAATSLADAITTVLGEPPEDVAIVIGPEGGLEHGEAAGIPGLIPVSLGATVLRTETAGVVGPALLAEHLRLAGQR